MTLGLAFIFRLDDWEGYWARSDVVASPHDLAEVHGNLLGAILLGNPGALLASNLLTLCYRERHVYREFAFEIGGGGDGAWTQLGNNVGVITLLVDEEVAIVTRAYDGI